MSIDPKKIWGIICIALAAGAMRLGFVIESVLFVVVGVSLIMNVKLWRR